MIRDIITILLVLAVIGLSLMVLTDEKMTPGFKERIERLKRQVEGIQDGAVLKKPLDESRAPEKNGRVNDPSREAGKIFEDFPTVKPDRKDPEPNLDMEPKDKPDKKYKQGKEDIPQPIIPRAPLPERLEQNKESKLSAKELQEILGLLKEARDSLKDSSFKYPKRPEALRDTHTPQNPSSLKKKSSDGPEESELSQP